MASVLSPCCYIPNLRKDIMDKEWRRRQAQVGRLQYVHNDAYDIDVRLESFVDIR